MSLSAASTSSRQVPAPIRLSGATSAIPGQRPQALAAEALGEGSRPGVPTPVAPGLHAPERREVLAVPCATTQVVTVRGDQGRPVHAPELPPLGVLPVLAYPHQTIRLGWRPGAALPPNTQMPDHQPPQRSGRASQPAGV